MMLKPASTADPTIEVTRDGVLRKELQRIFSQHSNAFPKQTGPAKAGTSSMREIKPWLTNGPAEDSTSIAIR